jgi:hypothetical protein
MPHEAWAASMDREFLTTLDPKEIGRQEVLNETMYSEEKYLSDLTILHEVSQGVYKTRRRAFSSNKRTLGCCSRS